MSKDFDDSHFTVFFAGVTLNYQTWHKIIPESFQRNLPEMLKMNLAVDIFHKFVINVTKTISQIEL